MVTDPSPEALALVKAWWDTSDRRFTTLARAIDAHTAAAVEAAVDSLNLQLRYQESREAAAVERARAEEREACATIAWKHRGAAERDRRAKGFGSSEHIAAEERGETIAAEIIAAAIRARGGDRG